MKTENNNSGFKRVVSDLAAAWCLLLRVPGPLPARWLGQSGFAASAWAFPLIGALIGACGGAVYYAGAGLDLAPISRAGLTLAVIILLTGALHEDGFADFWDSFGGRDRKRRLEIMRDSRIGTFGTLGLIFSVGLRWGSIYDLGNARTILAVLIASAALSRMACLVIMRFLNAARDDGLGALASGISLPVFTLGGISAVIITLVAMPLPLAGLFFAAVAVVSIVLIAVAKSRFGGFTGDVLGAGQQFCEIALLVLAASFF
ncbi:MAG: adenosylcobinamide-GDP ribazoletransferase [Fimbriimonadaceae bacterium]|nr:adenosylcobinamide-GDP ribazoletransferase [Alphaproteobacteria bacterium]